MNQQINLYLSEFRMKKDPLSALVMGQILGSIVAVMVLVTSFDIYTEWSLSGELAVLRETLQEETIKTSELDEVLARRSQNTVLTDRLDESEAQLESSRQIRSFLSQTKLGNVVGFSEHFKDISRASISGLSVSGFSFENGGEEVKLFGSVLDSAMVPRYVSRLENSNSSIRDLLFSSRIYRLDVNSSFFEFELSTSNE
ncbi:MAG: hypothetical protein JKY86_11945 [Gammaproteobacteria bacterium]|nr:hypothetical protein [Gammaproteobacteria bacterium]